MPAFYYRLLPVLATSVSLLLGACGSSDKPVDPEDAAILHPEAPQQASAQPDDMSDSTIWTIIGLADRPSKQRQGIQTGNDVSPVLWQACLDTLSFASVESQDPIAGFLVTNWYTPPNKPAERLRITAFIKARALRSDSLTVTIEREERAPAGQWQPTTVSKEVVYDLENTILQRARQIHAAQLRDKQK